MINKETIENLKVRIDLKDEDMPFIYNSFLKSCQHAFKFIPSELYFSQLKLVLIDILNNANVLIVHLDGDPDKIIGYCVYHRDNDVFVLHYLYVKHMYRNLGVAKNLLISAGYEKDKENGLASMPCKRNDIMLYKNLNLIYNPLILYKGVSLEEKV